MYCIFLRPGVADVQSMDEWMIKATIRQAEMRPHKLKQTLSGTVYLYYTEPVLDEQENYYGEDYVGRYGRALVTGVGIVVKKRGEELEGFDPLELQYWVNRLQPRTDLQGQAVRYIIEHGEYGDAWRQYLPIVTSRELVDTYEQLMETGHGDGRRAMGVLEELEKRGVELGGWGQ